jgi:hypothetical protein
VSDETEFYYIPCTVQYTTAELPQVAKNPKKPRHATSRITITNSLLLSSILEGRGLFD